MLQQTGSGFFWECADFLSWLLVLYFFWGKVSCSPYWQYELGLRGPWTHPLPASPPPWTETTGMGIMPQPCPALTVNSRGQQNAARKSSTAKWELEAGLSHPALCQPLAVCHPSVFRFFRVSSYETWKPFFLFPIFWYSQKTPFLVQIFLECF